MAAARQVERVIGLLHKNFECPICLELMINPYTTKCDHKFCRHCILEVVGHEPAAPCPICKLPFTKRSLRPLEQWGRMVRAVAELANAFQRDSGALFSPQHGASMPLSQEPPTPNLAGLSHALAHSSLGTEQEEREDWSAVLGDRSPTRAEETHITGKCAPRNPEQLSTNVDHSGTGGQTDNTQKRVMRPTEQTTGGEQSSEISGRRDSALGRGMKPTDPSPRGQQSNSTRGEQPEVLGRRDSAPGRDVGPTDPSPRGQQSNSTRGEQPEVLGRRDSAPGRGVGPTDPSPRGQQSNSTRGEQPEVLGRRDSALGRGMKPTDPSPRGQQSNSTRGEQPEVLGRRDSAPGRGVGPTDPSPRGLQSNSTRGEQPEVLGRRDSALGRGMKPTDPSPRGQQSNSTRGEQPEVLGRRDSAPGRGVGPTDPSPRGLQSNSTRGEQPEVLGRRDSALGRGMKPTDPSPRGQQSNSTRGEQPEVLGRRDSAPGRGVGPTDPSPRGQQSDPSPRGQQSNSTRGEQPEVLGRRDSAPGRGVGPTDPSPRGQQSNSTRGEQPEVLGRRDSAPGRGVGPTDPSPRGQQSNSTRGEQPEVLGRRDSAPGRGVGPTDPSPRGQQSNSTRGEQPEVLGRRDSAPGRGVGPTEPFTGGLSAGQTGSAQKLCVGPTRTEPNTTSRGRPTRMRRGARRAELNEPKEASHILQPQGASTVTEGRVETWPKPVSEESTGEDPVSASEGRDCNEPTLDVFRGGLVIRTYGRSGYSARPRATPHAPSPAPLHLRTRTRNTRSANSSPSMLFPDSWPMRTRSRSPQRPGRFSRSPQGPGRVSRSPQGPGRISRSPQGPGRVSSGPQGPGRVSRSPQGPGRVTCSPQGPGRVTGNPQTTGRVTRSLSAASREGGWRGRARSGGARKWPVSARSTEANAPDRADPKPGAERLNQATGRLTLKQPDGENKVPSARTASVLRRNRRHRAVVWEPGRSEGVTDVVSEPGSSEGAALPAGGTQDGAEKCEQWLEAAPDSQSPLLSAPLLNSRAHSPTHSRAQPPHNGAHSPTHSHAQPPHNHAHSPTHSHAQPPHNHAHSPTKGSAAGQNRCVQEEGQGVKLHVGQTASINEAKMTSDNSNISEPVSVGVVLQPVTFHQSTFGTGIIDKEKENEAPLPAPTELISNADSSDHSPTGRKKDSVSLLTSMKAVKRKHGPSLVGQEDGSGGLGALPTDQNTGGKSGSKRTLRSSNRPPVGRQVQKTASSFRARYLKHATTLKGNSTQANARSALKEVNGQPIPRASLATGRFFKSRARDTQRAVRLPRAAPVAFVHGSPRGAQDPYAFRLSQRTPRQPSKRANGRRPNRTARKQLPFPAGHAGNQLNATTHTAGGKVTSPQKNVTSRQAKATSPQAKAMSPQAKATSLQAKATSPQAKATSPQAKATSPQAKATSLQAKATSPQAKVTATNTNNEPLKPSLANVTTSQCAVSSLPPESQVRVVMETPLLEAGASQCVQTPESSNTEASESLLKPTAVQSQYAASVSASVKSVVRRRGKRVMDKSGVVDEGVLHESGGEGCREGDGAKPVDHRRGRRAKAKRGLDDQGVQGASGVAGGGVQQGGDNVGREEACVAALVRELREAEQHELVLSQHLRAQTKTQQAEDTTHTNCQQAGGTPKTGTQQAEHTAQSKTSTTLGEIQRTERKTQTKKQQANYTLRNHLQQAGFAAHSNAQQAGSTKQARITRQSKSQQSSHTATQNSTQATTPHQELSTLPGTAPSTVPDTIPETVCGTATNSFPDTATQESPPSCPSTHPRAGSRRRAEALAIQRMEFQQVVDGVRREDADSTAQHWQNTAMKTAHGTQNKGLSAHDTHNKDASAQHTQNKDTVSHATHNKDTVSHATQNKDTVSHATQNKDTVSHATQNKDTSAHGTQSKEASAHGTQNKDRITLDTQNNNASAHGTQTKDASAQGPQSTDARVYDTQNQDASAHGTQNKDRITLDTQNNNASAHGTQTKDASAQGPQSTDARVYDTQNQDASVHGTQNTGLSTPVTQSKQASAHGTQVKDASAHGTQNTGETTPVAQSKEAIVHGTQGTASLDEHGTQTTQDICADATPSSVELCGERAERARIVKEDGTCLSVLILLRGGHIHVLGQCPPNNDSQPDTKPSDIQTSAAKGASWAQREVNRDSKPGSRLSALQSAANRDSQPGPRPPALKAATEGTSLAQCEPNGDPQPGSRPPALPAATEGASWAQGGGASGGASLSAGEESTVDTTRDGTDNTKTLCRELPMTKRTMPRDPGEVTVKDDKASDAYIRYRGVQDETAEKTSMNSKEGETMSVNEGSAGGVSINDGEVMKMQQDADVESGGVSMGSGGEDHDSVTIPTLPPTRDEPEILSAGGRTEQKQPEQRFPEAAYHTCGPETDTCGSGTDTCGSGTDTCGPETLTLGPGTDTCIPESDTCRPDKYTCEPDISKCVPETEIFAPSVDKCHPETDIYVPETDTCGLNASRSLEGEEADEEGGEEEVVVLRASGFRGGRSLRGREVGEGAEGGRGAGCGGTERSLQSQLLLLQPRVTLTPLSLTLKHPTPKHSSPKHSPKHSSPKLPTPTHSSSKHPSTPHPMLKHSSPKNPTPLPPLPPFGSVERTVFSDLYDDEASPPSSPPQRTNMWNKETRDSPLERTSSSRTGLHAWEDRYEVRTRNAALTSRAPETENCDHDFDTEAASLRNPFRAEHPADAAPPAGGRSRTRRRHLKRKSSDSGLQERGMGQQDGGTEQQEGYNERFLHTGRNKRGVSEKAEEEGDGHQQQNVEEDVVVLSDTPSQHAQPTAGRRRRRAVILSDTESEMSEGEEGVTRKGEEVEEVECSVNREEAESTEGEEAVSVRRLDATSSSAVSSQSQPVNSQVRAALEEQVRMLQNEIEALQAQLQRPPEQRTQTHDKTRTQTRTHGTPRASHSVRSAQHNDKEAMGQKEAEPCQEEAEPCQEEAEPCQEEAEPCQEEAEPCQEDAELCQEEAEPCQEDAELCQEEAETCQEEGVSCSAEEADCASDEDIFEASLPARSPAHHVPDTEPLFHPAAHSPAPEPHSQTDLVAETPQEESPERMEVDAEDEVNRSIGEQNHASQPTPRSPTPPASLCASPPARQPPRGDTPDIEQYGTPTRRRPVVKSVVEPVLRPPCTDPPTPAASSLPTPRRQPLALLSTNQPGSGESPALKAEVKAEALWSPSLSSRSFPQRPGWLLATSGVSRVMHKPYVDKLVQLLGCSFTHKFSPAVSHLLVSPAETGALVCARTLKYFQGVAGRAWVLSVQWAVDSVKEGRLLSEGDYEVEGDSLGGLHGSPRRSRLATTPLLTHTELCFMGTFNLLNTEELCELGALVGAHVVAAPSNFSFRPGVTCLVLVEPAQVPALPQLPKLRRVYGLPVVAKDWLLDTIAEYSVKPLEPYLVFQD